MKQSVFSTIGDYLFSSKNQGVLSHAHELVREFYTFFASRMKSDGSYKSGELKCSRHKLNLLFAIICTIWCPLIGSKGDIEAEL
jgi:hypothetical protein